MAKCRFEFGREHIGHRAWPSCRNGNMAALRLLWSGERLSAPPPDERQIAHQVPDPTEVLVLMVSASRALLCTTHLLDRAVRSLLGANTRNWRGSFFRTFPEHSLCSLSGRVVDPAFSRDHFSLADLRDTSHPHGTRYPLRGRLEAPVRRQLLTGRGLQPKGSPSHSVAKSLVTSASRGGSRLHNKQGSGRHPRSCVI